MTFDNKDTAKLFERAKEIGKKYSRRHICENVLFAAYFPVFNLSSALILNRLGFEERELEVTSNHILENLKPHKNSSARLSPAVKEIYEGAVEIAAEEGCEVMPYHILVSFIAKMPQVFCDFGITRDQLTQAYIDFLSDTEITEQEIEIPIPDNISMFDSNPILDRFAENLNLKASQNEFGKIVDFDEKVDELITILCKKQKPNPILVGVAGTGKTSLVQALAQRIVNQDVPDLLLDTVIYSLNLSSMIAGTEYRGQFEQRMENLVVELKKYRNLVVFIDEIHTLVGAGNTQENTLDASNILKPDLARGTIRCIGATTVKEYNHTIKRDAALDRRFEKVLVREPSSYQMKQILPVILEQYSQEHFVEYTEEFVDSLLSYCDRFLPNRTYPDKAVDVIDHCGAKAKVKFFNFSGEIRQKKEDLQLELSKENIKNFCKELELINEKLSSGKPEVTKKDLVAFFEKYRNPVYNFCHDEKTKTLLKRSIVGQSKAFDKFISGLDSHIYGANVMKPQKNPMAFLLHGPEGCGRTLFCDSVSSRLEAEGANVIRLSGMGLSDYYARYKILNETRDEDSVAEQVILNPTSIIIVDGFDKCSESVQALFEEIVSKGKLHVGSGEVADFSNCQIIFTCDSVLDKKLGFGNQNNKQNFKPAIDLGSHCLVIQLSKPTERSLRRVIYNHLLKLNSNLFEMGGVKVQFDIEILKRLAKKAIKSDESFIDKMFLETIPRFVVGEINKGNKKILLDDAFPKQKNAPRQGSLGA